MRILLVHQYFLEPDDPGGSRFNEMTKVWAKQGHEITVLCGMLNYVTGRQHQKYRGKWVHTSNYHRNIKVIRSYVSERYNTNFHGRFWAYFSFVISSVYTGLFKTNGKYDVILTTSPPLFLGLTACLLKVVKRAPLLFEVRDLWPESAIETEVLTNKWIIRWSYWFERFIYKTAHKINVLTPAYTENLIKKKHIDPSKIIMIPNGADFLITDQLLEQFDPDELKNSLGLSNAFVVIYVGAHGIANDLIQLVEVAEILKDTSVHILLLGDGMQKSMLVEETKKRMLCNIQFIDPVPKSEVFKYILMSDIGVAVLRKTETFKTIYSNKTFDYMACRKPVVAAIDGVTRKLIEQAQCGSFAEPENPADLADKIKAYINKPALVKDQGNNGYNYAKAHFDRKVLAEKYLDCLKELAHQ